MKIVEVENILVRNKVPTNYYSFSGLGGGDLWLLEHFNQNWTISYVTERGTKSRVSTYETEDEACQAFLARMDKVLFDEQQRHLSY